METKEEAITELEKKKLDDSLQPSEAVAWPMSQGRFEALGVKSRPPDSLPGCSLTSTKEMPLTTA